MSILITLENLGYRLIDFGATEWTGLNIKGALNVDKHSVLENKNGIGVNETNSDTNLDTNETNFDTNNTNFDTNRNNTDTELILHLIQLNSKIRQKEIVEKTGISLSTVKRIMVKFKKREKLEEKEVIASVNR